MGLEFMQPEGVYQPWGNVYTQVIRSAGRRMVHVAGTVSLDADRNLVGEGNMGAQVQTTLEHIGRSLQAAGASPTNVVRIHIFTLDVDRYLQEGTPRTLEFFGDHRPVSTLVGISRLADPRYLVEIEVDAVID
jgi:2-iminobutanoate/2-iminopropanoate deaminase